MYNQKLCLGIIEGFDIPYSEQIKLMKNSGFEAFFIDDCKRHAPVEELVALSKELKNNFRESDILGRIGGDEFFVLMRNVTEQERVKQKADEILGIIQNVASKYLQVDLSGSVGISMYPKNGTTLDELYSKSDEALYEAKRTGKNKYIISEA